LKIHFVEEDGHAMGIEDGGEGGEDEDKKTEEVVKAASRESGGQRPLREIVLVP
jgi:hypothetical protein